MREPLGELLGLRSPTVTYSYFDCVKLAGHSCPTVAGAYLLTLCSLKKLYGDETPTRGELEVSIRDAKDNGTTGVIANVISYITGAKEEDGFKGLNGNYARNNKLFFKSDIKAEVRFKRLDTAQSIEASYDLSKVTLPALDGNLFKKILQKEATKEEIELFGVQWQERVRTILLDYGCQSIKLN